MEVTQYKVVRLAWGPAMQQLYQLLPEMPRGEGKVLL